MTAKRVLACIGILTLLAASYVLSIGPGLFLLKHGVISERTWQQIYYPLVGAAYQTKPTEEAIRWYMSLWIEEGPQ